MAIAPHIQKTMAGSAFIRKMFEEGIALKKQYGDDNVFDFSLGNPDLDPPKEVIDAIKEEALTNKKGTHGYMPNPGYPETRVAIAEKISLEQGVTVPFTSIVMSVGAAGALNIVLKTLLSPGDEVIVPSPFFVDYVRYAENHGGKLVPVSTKDDFSLDTDAIETQLSEKTAAVLINSPNNPTGKVYSKDDIARLASVLKKHGDKCGRIPYVIADEPYRNIIYNGLTVAPIFPVYENSIVVSSFAKDLSLPGERLGYVAVNPACKEVEDVIAGCVFCTRALGYVNAPAFFQRVIAKSWNAKVDYSSYTNRRDALTKNLRDACIEYAEPEGAFYLFCKVPEGKKAGAAFAGDNGTGKIKVDGQTSDGAFCDHLKKFCILGVPGTGFGRSGYIRLAYCVSSKTIENSAAAFKKAREEW